MYSTLFWNNIHEMEYKVYGGPASVEQNYDRDGRFLTVHPNRRDRKLTLPNDQPEFDSGIWYTIEIDELTGEVKYTFD